MAHIVDQATGEGMLLNFVWQLLWRHVSFGNPILLRFEARFISMKFSSSISSLLHVILVEDVFN
jgi:hypothetical protein